jgi:hypothetical protein
MPTTSTGPPILTADSACTETYVSLSCPVLNKRLTTNPIKIKIPNGATIESTHVAEVDLPMLRPAARKAHIVPALDNCSLLSLGQLCDAGYHILLEADTLSVIDAGEANKLLPNWLPLRTPLFFPHLYPRWKKPSLRAISQTSRAWMLNLFANIPLFPFPWPKAT